MTTRGTFTALAAVLRHSPVETSCLFPVFKHLKYSREGALTFSDQIADSAGVVDLYNCYVAVCEESPNRLPVWKRDVKQYHFKDYLLKNCFKLPEHKGVTPVVHVTGS